MPFSIPDEDRLHPVAFLPVVVAVVMLAGRPAAARTALVAGGGGCVAAAAATRWAWSVLRRETGRWTRLVPLVVPLGPLGGAGATVWLAAQTSGWIHDGLVAAAWANLAVAALLAVPCPWTFTGRSL